MRLIGRKQYQQSQLRAVLVRLVEDFQVVQLDEVAHIFLVAVHQVHITGGILGCRNGDPMIGWLGQVVLPDAKELDELADGLREVRCMAYG